MILRREVIAFCSFIGGFITSYSTPSMRKRTRKSFSYGSTWMSEAPFLIASSRMRFTSLTTGASSGALLEVDDVRRRLGLDDRDLGVVEASPSSRRAYGPFSA